MRVSVKYDEQPGGLTGRRTDIYLIFSIEFSDEEKQTIRQRRLEGLRIYGMRLDPYLVSPRIKWTPLSSRLPVIGIFFERPNRVTVADVLIHRTFIYKFDDAGSAKQFEAEVRESLAVFKNELIGNRDVGRDEVYDL
jgi:hypothetical protein